MCLWNDDFHRTDDQMWLYQILGLAPLTGVLFCFVLFSWHTESVLSVAVANVNSTDRVRWGAGGIRGL